MSKRVCKTLTLAQHVNVLERLENKESQSSIALLFGVNQSQTPLAGGEGGWLPLPKNPTPAVGPLGLELRASPLLSPHSKIRSDAAARVRPSHPPVSPAPSSCPGL